METAVEQENPLEEVLRKVIREEFGYREFYLPLVGTVVKDQPVRIDVFGALGYRARRGFISSLDGTIYVSLNRLDEFPLDAGEILSLDGILILRLDIRTDSTTPLRYKGMVI